MTSASASPGDPSLFDRPDADESSPDTPGNGNGLLVPRRRHRFAPGEPAGSGPATAPTTTGTVEAVAPVALAADLDAPAEVVTDRPHKLTRKEARQLKRLRARKVRRIVRHVDPWSVLRLSLLFYACLFVVLMVAGTILWNVAGAAGTIADLEGFVKDIGAFKTFSFDGPTIFRASLLSGFILVIAGSLFNVLLSVLFNLISDLVGGIRFTVIEEETARPIADGVQDGKR